MNRKGFTLVEIIAVIALLGLVLIIAMPNILDGGSNAKKKALESKIKNIEKAAVLYGQDNRDKINRLIIGTDDQNKYKYCFKDGNLINNCYYYEVKEDKNDNGMIEDNEIINTITVNDLATSREDSEGNTIEGYIKYDTVDNKILNSYDENKNINDCKIQIYQKYGKIYAVYNIEYKDSSIEDMKCWVD